MFLNQHADEAISQLEIVETLVKMGQETSGSKRQFNTADNTEAHDLLDKKI